MVLDNVSDYRSLGVHCWGWLLSWRLWPVCDLPVA
jgi:hypothetical protein